MTDKYCPLRFREYDSNPHDQRCIGEYCAWYRKCSQSHGEPRTATVETQTCVRTETDAETAQEPREADENACTQDSREKLEADVREFVYYRGWIDEDGYEETDTFIFRLFVEWLDRQAAITERECAERLNFKTITAVANELNADLQAQLDKLSSDELHWHSEADYWKRQYELICRAVEDVARNYTVVDEDGEVVS